MVTPSVTLYGPSTAVWIFQISGDLTLGSGAKVLLTGGAQAANVFWQVGRSAVEIGTTAAWLREPFWPKKRSICDWSVTERQGAGTDCCYIGEKQDCDPFFNQPHQPNHDIFIGC